jgi:hypothetical protein
LCRKESILLQCTGANARFWESSRIDCSEAAGRIGQFRVDTGSRVTTGYRRPRTGSHTTNQNSPKRARRIPHRAAPSLCSIENAGGEDNGCHPLTSASLTIYSRCADIAAMTGSFPSMLRTMRSDTLSPACLRASCTVLRISENMLHTVWIAKKQSLDAPDDAKGVHTERRGDGLRGTTRLCCAYQRNLKI